MLNKLLNRPCTVVRRQHDGGSFDDYGNEIATVVEVDTVCELQQRQRTDTTDRGEIYRTEWLLVLPAGTGLATGDTVIVDGDRYEVVGDPWRARNPRTGLQSHIEATLRRTAGPGDDMEAS